MNIKQICLLFALTGSAYGSRLGDATKDWTPARAGFAGAAAGAVVGGVWSLVDHYVVLKGQEKDLVLKINGKRKTDVPKSELDSELIRVRDNMKSVWRKIAPVVTLALLGGGLSFCLHARRVLRVLEDARKSQNEHREAEDLREVNGKMRRVVRMRSDDSALYSAMQTSVKDVFSQGVRSFTRSFDEDMIIPVLSECTIEQIKYKDPVSGDTPLHWIVSNPVRLLSSFLMRVSALGLSDDKTLFCAQNNVGITPLHNACLMRNQDNFKKLFTIVPEVIYMQSKCGHTPLHMNPACAVWLEEYLNDSARRECSAIATAVGMQDNIGETVLLRAVRVLSDGNEALGVLLLYDALAPERAINKADKTGVTPLISAAKHGKSGFVSVLVQAGADLGRSGNMAAPIFQAIKQGHIRIAEMLYAKSKELNLRNSEDRTIDEVWHDKWSVAPSEVFECPVCFYEGARIHEKTLPCNHVFHRECIDLWFKRSRTCPVCRAPS